MNLRLRLRLSALLAFTGAVLAVALPAAVADHPVIPLYPNGAPGSAARMHEPEQRTGNNITAVHHPSLTVYLPAADKATGCAVIVTPGGGHARLAIQHEGYAVAEWLAEHGVAAFILKYRLARDEANPKDAPQPYTIDRDELGDAQRAIRLVRSRAAEWGVRPDAVGILGFSAGGEVAILAATRGKAGDPASTDPIERQSSKPDFFAPIYPGGLQRTDLEINKSTPPVFLACGANDRPTISEVLPEFYLKCKRAGIDAELHIYAGAGHGFGIRETNKSPSGTWIARFHDWLGDRKFLQRPSP